MLSAEAASWGPAGDDEHFKASADGGLGYGDGMSKPFHKAEIGRAHV